MSWLSKLIDRYWKAALKAAVLKQLDQFSVAFQDGKLDNIEVAKGALTAYIQSQHRVPGELRRWACAVINDTDANDLLAWLSRVRASVKCW